MRRWRGVERLLVAALLPALIFAACGGGDDGEGANGGTGGDPTTTTGGTGAACPATPYPVVLKAARGSTIGVDDQSFRVQSSRAVSLAGGTGYTIYLANFDLPEGEVGGLVAPTPPDGKTLITIFLTTFNAEGTPPVIAKGDEIPFTMAFNKLTFRVASMVGDQSFSSFITAKGSFKVTELGDQICGEIDYVDSGTHDIAQVQNQLKGSIAATIKK